MSDNTCAADYIIHIIWVHYVASIHLRGHHEHERWKIRLCSTCKVLKCLCFINYECTGWIPCLLRFSAHGRQLFTPMWQCLWQHHPVRTRAIHPKGCWIEVQNSSYITQTNYNLRNMKLIPSIIWMTPLQSILSWFSFQETTLLMVICWLEAPKRKSSSGTWLVPPSSLHLWLRWKFFEKVANICLHHLVILSNCNTRFRGEKRELLQLEYSGEMQVLQKDFDTEKTYVDALWANKTYTEYRKTYQSSRLIQDVPFLRIFNHKTVYIWAIFRFVINYKHSGSQEKTYVDPKIAQNT